VSVSNEVSSKDSKDNLLEVVYDSGPVSVKWEDFDSIRARVAREWKASPKKHDPISPELKERVSNWITNQKNSLTEQKEAPKEAIKEVKS